MNIGDRVKQFRKSKKLSQVEFGNQLGVSRDVINNVENRRVDISELLLKSICQTFGVNEAWLRDGEGEMLLDNRESIFADIAKITDLTDTKRDFLTLFLDLPEDAQNSLRDYAKYLAAEYHKTHPKDKGGEKE